MPTKRTTTKKAAPKKAAALGPKAKLMKLAVTTLRNKAKTLGVKDVTKRTKENLVQSIILGEARKKRGTAAGKKATAKRAAAKPVPSRTTRRIEWRKTKDGYLERVVKQNRIPSALEIKQSQARKAKYPNVVPSKRDMQRVAKLPGKRVSNTGKTYYEYRVNRSDTGMGDYNGWRNYYTWLVNVYYDDFIADFISDMVEQGETSVYRIGESLKDSFEDIIYEEMPSNTFIQDLVNAGLSEVSWRELVLAAGSDFDLED